MCPNCQNGIILVPNPCSTSSNCDRSYSSDCVLIEGVLSCGNFGPRPKLTTVLQAFCQGFTNLGSQVTALQADQVFTKKIVLTPALLQSIFTSPVVLVPAPGVGKFIQILSVYGTFVHASPVYNLNGNSEFDISYGGGAFLTAPINLVAASGDKQTPFIFSSVLSTAGIANASVIVTTDVADLLSGGGTMTVYITYKILSV